MWSGSPNFIVAGSRSVEYEMSEHVPAVCGISRGIAEELAGQMFMKIDMFFFCDSWVPIQSGLFLLHERTAYTRIWSHIMGLETRANGASAISRTYLYLLTAIADRGMRTQ